jgi:hypothetical protein
MVYEYILRRRKRKKYHYMNTKKRSYVRVIKRKMQVFFILWNLNVDSFFFCLPWGG